MPFAPLGVMMMIFYIYFYEVKFRRPPNTYMRNMRLLQTVMQVGGDTFEVMYYVIEHFVFWKSKEKTLFTLNLCFLAFLGMLPIIVIPLRYLAVVGLWGLVSLSSPFCMAVAKSVIQVALEYGAVLERVLPGYIEGALVRIETVYIPRVQAVLRWVPYISKYIPDADAYRDAIERRKGGRRQREPEYAASFAPDRSTWVAGNQSMSDFGKDRSNSYIEVP